MTFNALSVVYVWIIQRKNHDSANGALLEMGEAKLYDLAETVQAHLAHATQSNAPSLRYSIILEELQQEARRLLKGESADDGYTNTAEASSSDRTDQDGSSVPWSELEWQSVDQGLIGDVDLFTHLDSFFSGQEVL